MTESVPSAAHRPTGGSTKRRGLFARIALFLRQIVAELRKVVRPSRNELWTYFVVVVVFVMAMMAYTAVLDFLFGRGVLFMFGAG